MKLSLIGQLALLTTVAFAVVGAYIYFRPPVLTPLSPAARRNAERLAKRDDFDPLD